MIPVRYILVLAHLSACSSQGRPLPEIVEEANSTLRAFSLEPGDELSVKFRTKVEWDHVARVRPDGRASFFLIGEVDLRGRNPSQLQTFLDDEYKKLAEAPQVSVLVRSVGPREIMVMGDVAQPGAVTVPSHHVTLFEALARVGGPLKETAELEQVLLIRSVTDAPGLIPSAATRSSSPCEVVATWKIDANHDYWETGAALLVQPGDILFVPNTAIDDLDIWVDQYIRKLIPLPNLSL